MTPQELKKSILQLAVQGKLVEQRPEEGTAAELYQQIQAKKQQLIKAGKLKKEKPLPEITEEEKPFDIPENWMWTHIGDLFQHNTGKALNVADASGTPYTYITTSNVYWNYCKLDKLKTMRFTEAELEKCTVQKGDLLVLEGGDVGRAAIWNNDFPMRIQNHIHRVRPYGRVCIEFFYHIFFLYRNTGRINGKGIGIKGLSTGALHSLVIPLPPLAEQRRIVAKIEELLPYIDRYGQAWSRLDALNKRFPDKIQKSILQLAVQGKLVEQRPEEGTAAELYQQIRAKKQQLIKAGKIKKEKPLPEITDEEKPFEIPESWMWVRLGDITNYAQPKGRIGASEITGDMWSLDLEDIEKETGKILKTCNASDRKIEGGKVLFCKGQILYSKLRPYLKKILVASADGICSSEIVPFESYDRVSPDYFVYYLKSPYVDNAINSVTYGEKMPRVGTKTMVNLLVSLPPLAEQKRIVAKIEELLGACEKLKRAILR